MNYHPNDVDNWIFVGVAVKLPLQRCFSIDSYRLRRQYIPSPIAASMSIAHVDGSGTAVNDPAPESGPLATGVMVNVAPAPMSSESWAIDVTVMDDPEPSVVEPVPLRVPAA